MHSRNVSYCAVVKKGHIVEQGTHAKLMAANREYATLVALQQAEGGMQGAADDGEHSGSEGDGQEVSQGKWLFPSFPSLCSGAEGLVSVLVIALQQLSTRTLLPVAAT